MKERIGQNLIDYLVEGVDYQSDISTQEALLTKGFDLSCLAIMACFPDSLRLFSIVFSIGLVFAFLETHYILFSSPLISQTSDNLACPTEVATLITALCLVNNDCRMLLLIILGLCIVSDLAGFLAMRYLSSILSSLLAQVLVPAILVIVGCSTGLIDYDYLVLVNVGLFAIVGQYCTRSLEKSLGISRSNYRRVHTTPDLYTDFLRKINPDQWLGLSLRGPSGYLDRLCGFISASSITLLIKTLLH